MTFYNVEINGTFQNITLSRDALRVLADSMPIFPIIFYENGTQRPVICASPPKDDAAGVYITSSLLIICCVIALITTYIVVQEWHTR